MLLCLEVSQINGNNSKKNERRQVNEKILQIIKGNIGMVIKQWETRQGWIVHNG